MFRGLHWLKSIWDLHPLGNISAASGPSCIVDSHSIMQLRPKVMKISLMSLYWASNQVMKASEILCNLCGLYKILAPSIIRLFKSIFCQLNCIALSQFLIKYYHIMFIIIVYWLGSDKLYCFFYCLSQGTSHGMWLLASGRVMLFHFRLFKSILFFVNWISLCFFHLI